MQTIAASEARGNFAEILEQVHYGKSRVAIERRGKPFAALVPIEDLELIEGPRAEALRRSEARLRAIMDHAPLEIYLKDAEGRTVEVNRRHQTLWGGGNEGIAEAWREQDLAVLESGEAIQQADERHPGDPDRTLRTTRFPIRDETGEISGMGAIAIDVTDRRKAEEALREARALYRQTERLAKLGFWQWDEREDKSTFCSHELARLHGVSVEEYIGRTDSSEADLQWVHPDDRERVERISEEAKRHGTGFECEYRMVRADGDIIDVLEASMPICDETGALVRSIGFVQDITERKRAEDDLKESEVRFRDFADATSDWFWEMDEDCRFSYFSERFTEITGVPHEALLGKTREETGIPDINPEAWEKHLSDLAMRRSFRDFRHPRTLSDGRVVHLSINGKAVFDQAGGFRGYRGTGSDITDRKQAEDALRESEAALERAQRQARIGSWRRSVARDEFVSCSKEIARIYGVGMDEIHELMNHQFERVVHPDDRHRVAEVFQRAADEGVDYDIGYRIVRPDGEVRHVQEIGECIPDGEGRTLELFGTVQDITERKEAEDVLRRSEERFKGVFDFGLVGMAVLAPDGRFQEVNKAYRDFLGYGADELIGEHFELVVHPDDLPGVGRRLEQLLSGEVAGYHHERRYRHKQGHGIWGLASLSPLLNRDGTPRGFIVQVQDITERKIAEEALRQSEARFRAFLDSSPEPISLKDAEGRYLLGNKELERWCGLTEAEMRGKSEEEIFPGNAEIGHRILDHERRVMQSMSVIREEREAAAPDGALRWYSITKFPVLNASGDLAAIGTTNTDVTELKRTEEALRRARDELELRVEERTAELRTANAALTREIGERKQAEAEAERSRALLAAAVEALDEGFVIFDDESRMVLCNSKYRKIYGPVAESWKPGVSLARIAREKARHTVGLESEEEIEAWVRERLSRHGKTREPFEQSFEDGRWIRVADNLLPNGWTVGTRTDLTDLKRVEEQLRNTQTRLIDAIESISDAFILFDADEHMVLCNSRYREFFSAITDVLVPGVGLEELLRIAAERRQMAGAAEDPGTWVRERLDRYRAAEGTWEEQTGDGRWVLIAERRTREGGIVGIRSDITERKRSEDALRESEEMFSKAFHASPGMFAISRPEDGAHYDVNEAWMTTLGYTHEEAMAHSALELGVWADSSDRARFVERLTKERSVRGFEAKFRTKSGELLDFLVSGEYIEAGGEPRLLVVSHDITERKRWEEVLRESEERLRQATQLAGLGYYIWDSIADRCLHCSEEFARIHGTNVEDYMARSSALDGLWSFTHPEDRDAYIAGIEKVRRGEDFELEYRVVTPNGETRYVAESIKPVVDEDGRVVQEYGTIQDITEQKRVEEELRESEERYRELFDESPVAIWVEDWSPIKRMLDGPARGGVKDWRGYFDSHRDQLGTAYDSAAVLDISRATIELYRKESKEHMLRMSAAAVVIDEELDAFREMVLSFLAGQTTVDIESKDTAGDGSEIIVRRRVVIPPKYHDDWSRVIFAIEDITERARLEEQLRQAQKMEVVGQLTGGIAHDFNNLLAVIMGNAEFLGDELGESDRSVSSILRAATRGAELTQRLLAFSRQQPLHPRAIDLGGLVAGMTDLIGRTLGETIEVDSAFAEDAWMALADPGQVENALLNLAINARDSMPEGGRLLIEVMNAALDDDYASAHMEVKPGDYLMLAVSDSGSGMEPEVLERVFEPFFTTKDVGEGSGLGLSMVYGFAKQSGGDVRIYSEPGHGTTVKLYLPRAGADGGPSVEDGAARQTPRGHGETVLVVEDDPDVRALAERLLVDLGYRVLSASDARAGMRALEDAPHVDLLLSDVVLPGGMSGLDFAAEAARRDPAIKRLFMSGYTGAAANGRRPLPAGADLLDKPFRKHDLAVKVRAALDG